MECIDFFVATGIHCPIIPADMMNYDSIWNCHPSYIHHFFPTVYRLIRRLHISKVSKGLNHITYQPTLPTISEEDDDLSTSPSSPVILNDPCIFLPFFDHFEHDLDLHEPDLDDVE